MINFIFLFGLLIIPLSYFLYINDIKKLFCWTVMIFWFPIPLPIGGFFEGIKYSEFFIYVIYFYLLSQNVTSKTKIAPYLYMSFGLILVGAITSINNSINNIYLYHGIRNLIILPLLILLSVNKIVKSNEDVKNIFHSLVFGAVLLVVFIYVLPNSWEMLYLREESQAQRFGGIFILFNKYESYFYESMLAVCLSSILPIAVINYYIEKKLINLVFLFLLIIAIIFTMGRSGIVAGIIGLLCAVVLLIGRVKKIKAIYLLLFSIFIIWSILSNLTSKTLLSERMLSLSDFTSAPNFQARMEAWNIAWSVLEKSIWGIGFFNLESITYGRLAGNSTFISMLLDIGILGTTGYLLMIIITIKKTFAYRKLKNVSLSCYSIGAFSSMIAFMIGSLTENMLQSQLWTIIPFMTVLSISVKIHHLKNVMRSQNEPIIKQAQEIYP